MTAADASSPAAPDDVPWFYRTDQGKIGPVSLADLRDTIATGRISVETPVWRHGMSGWVPAPACEELRQAVAANRASSATRAGTRPAGPRAALMAASGITAAIVTWQLLSWMLGFMAVAHVTGTVTAASRPVTGGCVILSPIGDGRTDAAGKPGVANIMPDGRFSLRITPGTRGFAVRYGVRFSPPVLPPLGEAEAMTAVPAYSGLVPKTREVSLHAGTNTLDIEIVPVSRD